MSSQPRSFADFFLRHAAKRTRFAATAITTITLVSVNTKASSASLSDDAMRVAGTWIEASQSVTHMRPRFLMSGEGLPIEAQVGRDPAGCTSIGVLASRTTDFLLQTKAAVLSRAKADNNNGEAGIQSIAGAAMIAQCGAAQSKLDGLVIRMKSSSAVVEVLVAHGKEPAPAFDDSLPERDPGMMLPTERAGLLPSVAPLSDRLDAATRMIRETGGVVEQPTELQADRNGNASQRVFLAAGCHRFVASPAPPTSGRARPTDADIEVRLTDGQVVQDRSFAPDAMVDFCIGEPALSSFVSVSGASPGGSVSLLHGSWPIPKSIPADWLPAAKAASARALLHRRWPSLPPEPIWEAVGAAGSTAMNVPVDTGACYVAVVAGVSADRIRTMHLQARVGPRAAIDYGLKGVDSALVSFCAESERMARLIVTTYGSRIMWNAAVWRVSSIQMGANDLL